MHATHLTDGDVELLGGVGHPRLLLPHHRARPRRRDRAVRGGCTTPGRPLTLGSDSHAVIDLFEEMRAVELDERLATQARGHWSADELLDRGDRATGTARSASPTSAGSRSARAPTSSPSTPPASARPAPAPTRAPRCSRRPPPTSSRWSATASWSPTRTTAAPPVAELDRVVRRSGSADEQSARCSPASASCHQRPRPARLLGLLRDAALVVEDGRVAWVGPAPAGPGGRHAPTTSAAGPSSPGFVDSHAHLVFAGDRAEEFAARMTGTPYSAGGIRTTVAATRAATDEQLAANLARLVDEMRRQGTTTVEVKSGYGLTVHDEARSLAIARQVTDGDHLPRRARGAARARRRPRGVRRPGDRPDARRPARRTRAGSTCSASAAPSTPTRPGRPRGRRARTGCAAGCTPTSSAPAPACGWRASSGWPRVDHCTYLADADVDALAASGTTATLLPGVEFSTRSPYPDARRLLDAGVPRRARQRLQPRLLLHLLDAAVHRARRAGDGDVARPRRWAPRPRGGAAALRPRRRRPPAASARAADLAVLDAPSYLHLAYRPGVPLVRETFLAGRPVLG